MTGTKNTIGFYIRVSTKLQDTLEGSLVSQKQRLIEWFEYNNSQAKFADEKIEYSNYIIYQDIETGTKAAKRPAYKRMLADIRMGKLNAIASASISRLNRNLREFYELYDITKLQQVDLISLKESFDTTTAIGRAILKFMLVFYELESEQTSERGKDNRYARAKRGLWVTATVTGYNKDPEKPGVLIPIPSEVEVVKLMFELYLKLGSLNNVRKELNQRQILTPARKMTGTNSGKPQKYSTVTIGRILQNKVYIGVQQYQKGKKGIDGLPPGEAYEEIPGNWEPIIDKDIFDKVQVQLIKNKESHTNQISGKKKIFELSSLIKCGSCKTNPIYKPGSGTSKTKKIYYYYLCPECRKTLRADKIESEVFRVFDELGKNKSLIKRLIKEYHKNYNLELDELKGRLIDLQNEEKIIEDAIQKEADKFVKLEGSEFDLFKKQAVKIHEKLQGKYISNQKSKDEVERLIMEAEVSSIDSGILTEIMKNLSKVFPDLPIPTRKALLNQVVTGITIFKDYAEMGIGERIFTLDLKKKHSANAGFTECYIERDGRDSNSQLPA